MFEPGGREGAAAWRMDGSRLRATDADCVVLFGTGKAGLGWEVHA